MQRKWYRCFWKTEKYTNRRVPNIHTFPFCWPQTWRGENASRNSVGTQTVHILHVTYGRKSRSSRSLKEGLTSVPDILPLMLLYTIHYKNSSSYIQFMQELLPQDAPCVFSMDLRLSAEDTKFRIETFFTDQSCFTRTEITGTHNENVWSSGNPHSIGYHHQQ
jgi:hypothetical protein